MAKGTEFLVAQEDQRRDLADDDIQILDFGEEGGVEEEEEHVDEGFQDLAVVVGLALAVEGDAFADVVVDHPDELALVLLGQLQRHLLQTVNDQAQSVLLLLVTHQQVDFLHQQLSRRLLEMRVQVVSQPFSVVGDHFDLELRHGRLHHFVYHAVHHAVGVCEEEVF
jgi:hypothetical protein